MVNATRDKPHLPSDADLTALTAEPTVADFFQKGPKQD
jgi:hypothetical protein